ncbi:ACRO protein, partial [Menura novaehollandiae]|nr:ACRO protein [Menura novaehollandiae]
AQMRRIKKLVRHEYYRRRDMSYDIALLELNKPVECNPYIQLGCLANPMLRMSELRNCWVAGWGSTSATGEFPGRRSDHLQEAKVQLIDLQLCNSSRWYAGEIHTHNLCAGHQRDTVDTCQGDSGGPLMCKVNKVNSFWIVGVTSWGKGCGRARRPGI